MPDSSSSFETSNESTPSLGADSFGNRLVPPGFDSPPSWNGFQSVFSAGTHYFNEPGSRDYPAAKSIPGTSEENMRHARLREWLPMVLEGYDASLTSMFADRLETEAGFVVVQDLLDAKKAGSLTFELLCDVTNMKIGHYNRLCKALNGFDI